MPAPPPTIDAGHGLGDALAEITDRLHTALLTVRCLPGDGPRGLFSTWPAYAHDWWDWGSEESRRSDADIVRRLLSPPRFVPTARQVDDCLPTLALLEGCDRNAFKVLTARARQDWYGGQGGWRAIGRACGMSHEAARKTHWAACVSALERHIALGGFSRGVVDKPLALGHRRRRNLARPR